MFYDDLNKLCAEKGISVSALMNLLGVSTSTAARWKTKGYKPSKPVAKQIADYFGISVEQLMSGKIEEAPAEAEAQDKELESILEAARADPDKRILFSLGSKANPAEVKKYIQMIKLMCGDENGTGDC